MHATHSATGRTSSTATAASYTARISAAAPEATDGTKAPVKANASVIARPHQRVWTTRRVDIAHHWIATYPVTE
jgi:hypothetical protein